MISENRGDNTEHISFLLASSGKLILHPICLISEEGITRVEMPNWY